MPERTMVWDGASAAPGWPAGNGKMPSTRTKPVLIAFGAGLVAAGLGFAFLGRTQPSRGPDAGANAAVSGPVAATRAAAASGALPAEIAPPPELSPIPPAPVAAPLPFRAGEALAYRVLFSKFGVKAATIETSVMAQRNFFGERAWHFRVTARTTDTTRLLFPLDDQFDSYTAVAGFTSLQYEMYLSEQGKQQTSRYRLTGESAGAPDNATAVRVPEGTRDAVGFLYALRAADWRNAPVMRGPVFDGRRLYQAVARMEIPDGAVEVQGVRIAASRIAVRLFDQGKEVTDTRLWVWIAKDAARAPVLIEAETPMGSGRVELLPSP